MGRIAPTKIFLLALMLAVSHVALVSHVTAHFSPDLELCELCVSQAQFQAAIPAADHVCPVQSALEGQPDHAPRDGIADRVPKAHRQRAPPLSSA
ncbi:MAG: hypothetical protein HKN57_00155 [Xanthomonadales bacterium]|nr:hypothetical protein [Gammaproteobacteria bacterium]MBT8053372.1 hypothetical protein [Gammaproteobacteria bacterium]NND55639.1 hypothetical protein [Xanthomonadales bacterium]NNK50492.1 hypothetical protein [Xanthomonadales bacterium]